MFSAGCKQMALIHRNVKNTMIMFQCKNILEYLLSLNPMLVRLLVEVDKVSVFLIMDW